MFDKLQFVADAAKKALVRRQLKFVGLPGETAKMRIPTLLLTMTIALLSLAAGDRWAAANATSRKPITYDSNLSGQGTPRFSSAYTDLTKCGSGLTKKEEKEAEAQGSDIPTRCKAYGGYDVYIYYSACTAEITLEKGDETIHIATQAGDFKQKSVEWRLANGKPFAVIMRVWEYAGDDNCATGGKVVGESLIVKGLKGYEQIDGEVKVKGTPNANEQARAIADKGFR